MGYYYYRMPASQRVAVQGGEVAAVCDYFLLAPFDGAANQGYADAQVLNTEAEGVAVGSMTVDETDGTVSLVGGELIITPQVTPSWGDLGVVSNSITRSVGRGFLLSWEKDASDDTGPSIGFHSVAAPLRVIEAGLYVTFGPTAFYAYVNGSLEGQIGTYAADTQYETAIILGGYDTNGQPWHSGAAGVFTYGMSIFVKGGTYTDWTLLWRGQEGNTATLYATLANHNADIDASYLRVPDHDYSAVLQPTAADWFTDTNGTSLDAHTPDVDPGGGWTERVGNWQITGNEAVIAAQTDRACATMAAGIADIWGRDSLESNTADATTAGDAALVYRWVDNDNYWYAGINDAANAFRIVERSGGAETVRATAAVAIGTGTQYEVTIQVEGNVHQAWLNGGNRLTHTSASHNTATVCGVRSKETTDAHDNFHVQPASVYADLDDCPGYAVTP